MKAPTRAAILMVLITLVAAAAGGAAGYVYGVRSQQRPDLNDVIHRELRLTAEQDRKVDALEAQFRTHEVSLKAQMRAANRDLADALDQDHAYGPRAQAAMDRFHMAEKDLQASTIRHILSMRAVLNPEQARKLDDAIRKALTTGS